MIELCEHDWKPTGMFLMKHADVYAAAGIVGRQIVGGTEGYYKHQTPPVDVCKKCGLLRINPQLLFEDKT